MACSDESSAMDGSNAPLEVLASHLPPGSIARLREIGLATVRDLVSYLVPASALDRVAQYLKMEPEPIEAVVVQARSLLSEATLSAIDHLQARRDFWLFCLLLVLVDEADPDQASIPFNGVVR